MKRYAEKASYLKMLRDFLTCEEGKIELKSKKPKDKKKGQ